MTGFDAYCDLEGTITGTLSYNEPMARHTSYRIGGPALLYVECASVADINRCLEVCAKHGLSWCVAGKGSNLLVSDEGFRGAIITLGSDFKNFSFPEESEGETLLVAGAGVVLSTLVQSAFKNGYSGLEFAVGIPGSLGGALFMNAGGATEWIGAIAHTLTVLRPGQGLVRYGARELPWSYRRSGVPTGELILEAALKVSKGHLGQIRAKMEASLKRRRKTQPLTLPSAGSVFRNPPEAAAAQLIESLGLKGYQVGGAQVSEMHANFIVNVGAATAADVIAIIMHIRERVKEEYGTELQPEVRFVGFS
ncbi:MAG: UDP-N-acetylmuramate dehydrogenase [Coriobacteriales bacterium]|jgi:UDP-N-acetylmuramate dehydrogenase|nr:UDP-N-acetylmuramate dehydrogenase [Coriobacteriales bacterium]